MKTFKELIKQRQNILEDHAGYVGDSMTQKEIKIAITSAKNILDMIYDGQTLMRWQISAIVKAADELSSVNSSMAADKMDHDDDFYDEDEYFSINPFSAFGEESELSEAIQIRTGRNKGKWRHSYSKPGEAWDTEKEADAAYDDYVKQSRKTKVKLSDLKPQP